MIEFLPDYSHLTPMLILLYALAGVLGALVRVSWLDKPLRGVYRDSSGGIRLGFFGEIIVGIAVAIVVDGNPVRAGTAAVFAPWILEAIKLQLLRGNKEVSTTKPTRMEE